MKTQGIMPEGQKNAGNENPLFDQRNVKTDVGSSSASVFVTLAPLAGVSDMPFRELCFSWGADGATTEMVSAQAIFYGNHRTEDLLEKGEEGSLTLQLFGKNPDILSQVIRTHFNEDPRFSAIELNMGCPAPKIVKNGEGSALMKNPLLVGRILGAMVQTSSKPVHIKMRLGWDETSINYLEIAHIAEEEGISQITLHARTREQQYSGQADWSAIARLKEEVRIPVVGNGDVDTPERALAMVQNTGCDGIAIGRGAMGNPFLFQEIKSYLKHGSYARPSIDVVIETLKKHYEKEVRMRGETRALLEMRKHIAWYIAGTYGAGKTKAKIMTAETKKEVFSILKTFVDQVHEREAMDSRGCTE